MKKTSIWLLAVPTIILMAMGLVFCWVTPANAYLHGDGSRFFFTHMLCWTTIGLSLATCTYLVGWRRRLKATPFIAAGWVGLVAYAATCPLVNGHWGWISLGCLRINVWEFVPVVAALVAAYFVWRLKCKAIWTVGMALIVVAVSVGNRIIGWQNRFERDMEVEGKNISCDGTRKVMVSSEEIRKVLAGQVSLIVKSVCEVIREAGPKYAKGIRNRGIVLSGGGSLLRGLDEMLAKETGFDVVRVDNPESSSIKGVGAMIGNTCWGVNELGKRWQ